MRESTRGFDVVLAELLLDNGLDLRQKGFALLALGFDGVLDLVISDGVNVLEGKVLELAADLAHAQPVRDGGVNLLRLAGDLDLPLGRKVFEGAHVVQAVGQLDHDHANVVHHGQHHLADALGLGLFAGSELDFADLGDALDDVRNLLAEFVADVVDRDRSVFDGVVEQAGGNCRGVQLHVGQHRGNFKGMNEIGLAGGAGLALMVAEGEVVGFLDQRQIVVGTIGANLAQEIAKLGHRKDVGSDLLAESRHDRLYASCDLWLDAAATSYSRSRRDYE